MKERLDRPSLEDKGEAHKTLQNYLDRTSYEYSGKQAVTAVSSASQTVDAYLKQRSRLVKRRKWTGRGLSALGAATLLSSCAVSIFSTTGLYSAGIGFALLVGGLGISSWKPRLKDTTEALIAAHKYGSVINTTRLALEMDISPERAEAILKELVKSGIAEIEIDRQAGNGNLNYRIKGL